MPISASRTRRGLGRQAGYSLLEILIVLSLLGLAATIAGPSVGRWVDQARHRAALQSLDRVLLEQRREAVVSARSVSAEEITEAVSLRLGEGWSVQATETLGYSALGYCPGAEVVLQDSAGRTYRRVLAQGDCRPV